MNARDVKDKLYIRHAATQYMGSRRVPGGWTVVEELFGIDVLAFSAHASPKPAVSGVRYPRVGYEVKVSRSDYRREVLNPSKRTWAVEWCNAYYFAVPAGLLTPDEIAYDEPEWEEGDFRRTPCPRALSTRRDFLDDPEAWRNRCHRGEITVPLVGPIQAYGFRKDDPRYWPTERDRPNVEVPCPECGGKGYMEKSRVEREAPTLWVPRDVGLIVIDGRGCSVAKKAPIRKAVEDIPAGHRLNDMIRWISARPDPRHRDLLYPHRPIGG